MINNKPFLIALSPFDGIAFFEFNKQKFEMNVCSGKIEKIEEAAMDHLMSVEYGLKPVNKEFSADEELKKYVWKEYLREKKETYYILLITKELSNSTRSKIIKSLDDEEFIQVDFSPEIRGNLISILKVKENQDRFPELLQEVEEAKANNVKSCLDKIQDISKQKETQQDSEQSSVALYTKDEQFIEIVVNSDSPERRQEAFACLYHRYERSLYKYVCSISGDPTKSEDIVMETWTKIIQNIDSIIKRESFKSFLFITARNCYIDECRNRNVPTEDDKLNAMINNEDFVTIDTLDTLSVDQAMEKLPNKEYEIIYLHFYEGFTFNKIAKIMHKSLRNIHDTKDKAYAKLLDIQKG